MLKLIFVSKIADQVLSFDNQNSYEQLMGKDFLSELIYIFAPEHTAVVESNITNYHITIN